MSLVINEKIKKFTEPKNLVVGSFFTQKALSARWQKKQKLVLLKTAKEVYLLLAGRKSE